MKNRIFLGLLGLILTMQCLILYRQYRVSNGRRPPVDVRVAERNTEIDLTNLPLEGNIEAKVGLVEFADYECPYCERHANGVGKELRQRFLFSGKVIHAFVNNPMPNHDNARFLATAAICAGAQRRYWEMHELIFKQKLRKLEDFLPFTQGIGLNQLEFRECIDKGAMFSDRIDGDIKTAKTFGLTGTPAFAVGYVTSPGMLSVEKFIVGAQPFAIFEKVLNELLVKKH